MLVQFVCIVFFLGRQSPRVFVMNVDAHVGLCAAGLVVVSACVHRVTLGFVVDYFIFSILLAARVVRGGGVCGGVAAAVHVPEEEGDDDDDDDDGDADSESDDEHELLHRRPRLVAVAGLAHIAAHHHHGRVRRLRRGHQGLVNLGHKSVGKLATFSVISFRALALVVVDLIGAVAAVEAGRGGALVHVQAAVLALEAGSAVAAKVVHQVVARAAVGAWPVEAVVDVRLAQLADEARGAAALEVVDAVFAGAAVEAGRHRAVVGVLRAAHTAPAARAHAAEPVALVNAPTPCNTQTALCQYRV